MLKDDNHKKWEKNLYIRGESSARSMPIGYIIYKDFLPRRFKLLDKIIKPINTCPDCKSHNTFHKKIQSLKDFTDNVYDVQVIKKDKNSRISFKFDYCFDCSKKFLIESFIFTIERLCILKWPEYYFDILKCFLLRKFRGVKWKR